MKCDDIEKKIEDYLSYALPGDEEKLFMAHLEQCANCKSEVEKTKRLLNQMKSLPQMSAPKGFAEEVHLRIEKVARRQQVSKKIFIPSDMESLPHPCAPQRIEEPVPFLSERAIRRRDVFRKLFFPLHWKIPMELAATLIVGFFIVRVMLPHHPISKGPYVEVQKDQYPREKAGGRTSLLQDKTPLSGLGKGEQEMKDKKTESFEPVPERQGVVQAQSPNVDKAVLSEAQTSEELLLMNRDAVRLSKEEEPLIVSESMMVPVPAAPMKVEVLEEEKAVAPGSSYPKERTQEPREAVAPAMGTVEESISQGVLPEQSAPRVEEAATHSESLSVQREVKLDRAGARAHETSPVSLASFTSEEKRLKGRVDRPSESPLFERAGMVAGEGKGSDLHLQRFRWSGLNDQSVTEFENYLKVQNIQWSLLNSATRRIYLKSDQVASVQNWLKAHGEVESNLQKTEKPSDERKKFLILDFDIESKYD